MDALTTEIDKLARGSWVRDQTGKWVDYTSHPVSHLFKPFSGSDNCDPTFSLEDDEDDAQLRSLEEELSSDPDGNEQTDQNPQESEVDRRRKGLQAKLERDYYVPPNPFYQRIEDLSPEHRELYENYTSAALEQMKNSRFYPGANLRYYQDRFMRLDQLNFTDEMMNRAKQLSMDVFKALLYLKAADDAYGGDSEFSPLMLKYGKELGEAEKQLKNVLDDVHLYLSRAVNKKAQNFFQPVYGSRPLAALARSI
ncbi:hypothetical protein HYU06_01740 [Candidatus Woesearchaeota archaeon]|nr:hypothetical protein [Candidatus Woesearchaeota archaeon]